MPLVEFYGGPKDGAVMEVQEALPIINFAGPPMPASVAPDTPGPQEVTVHRLTYVKGLLSPRTGRWRYDYQKP